MVFKTNTLEKMRFFLLLIIKLYWNIIPVSKRKSCLFAESCSKYVYRVTKENGFISGVMAFKNRYRKCRPGFKIVHNALDSTTELHLIDGTILSENEISSSFKTN